jgi:hypothetical protein
MALLNRLTSNGEDKIHHHSFFALIYEYARGEITEAGIRDLYNIGVDAQADALFGLIEDVTGITSKILKTMEIENILSIHEEEQTCEIYPNGNSIATRLGI